MSGQPPDREAAALVAGFALWSLAFVLLYGAHGTICSVGASSGLGPRAILIILWALMLAAHVALIAFFAARLRKASMLSRFVRLAALVLSIAAFGATIWTGIPVISLQVC